MAETAIQFPSRGDILDQLDKEDLINLLIESKEEKDALHSLVKKHLSKGDRATEGDLGNCHGTLAQVITEQLLYKDPMISYDEDGNMVEGEDRFVASPALINAARGFLKDNAIVTDLSTGENIIALTEAFAERERKGIRRHSDRLPKTTELEELE